VAASTSFETAIGPLAGSFPTVSLRTNETDVVVAVPQDIANKLDASGEKMESERKVSNISQKYRTSEWTVF